MHNIFICVGKHKYFIFYTIECDSHVFKYKYIIYNFFIILSHANWDFSINKFWW